MAKSYDHLLGTVSHSATRKSGALPASGNLSRVNEVGSNVPSRETAIVGEAYDGASLRQREIAAWTPPDYSADRDIIPQKKLADARTRDMVRNDAYVLTGTNARKDIIVGGHYALNAEPNTRILLGEEDDKWEEEFQQEVEERFFLWAESDECWPDASRKQTFTGLVRQVTGMDVFCGESLSIVEWAREDEILRTHNTAIRVIDMNRLVTPNNKAHDKSVVAGVQLNDRHIAEGYFIRKSHPVDRMQLTAEWEYVPKRLPWGRRQAMHIFEAMRPDQTRGIADMVAGLMEMRMTKDFRAAVLQNAFVQATYAATIESDLDTGAIFQRLGGGNLGEDEVFAGMGSYMAAHLGAVKDFIGDSKALQMNGVKIPHLPPGSKLQLRPIGQGGPLGTEFEQSLLRHLAALLGLSYEQLSKDYTNTNYSSSKAADRETNKFMSARKKMVSDRFANMVYRLWLEETLNKGLLTTMKYSKLPNFYEKGMADAYCSASWIGPGRGQIDELKETQAATLRLKYNITTAEEEIGRTGRDWRRVYKQIAREKKLRKDLDIEIETDTNMENASTGAPRDKSTSASYDALLMTDEERAALATADDKDDDNAA